jgi:UDPglucose 6-dehydrogenase
MKVCVLGLWHLGSVTAACLASLGHEVTGHDFDEVRVANLNRGIAPLFEPGLEQLIKSGLSSGELRFTARTAEAFQDADVLWITYDTPVDADDQANQEFVMTQIERVLVALNTDVPVMISSQLPVGSIRRLEQLPALNHRAAPINFAYSPENLRFGSAMNDFLHPARIVAGIRPDRDRAVLQTLLSAISPSIEWMSIESAEMTKHAINAFLATSVVFTNELASICEAVGADARDVERGLKTETRIGPRAYLAPGAAFAGGSLARDIGFLNQMARQHHVNTPLLRAVLPSNDRHKRWAQEKLALLFADLSQTTVAVWGLTYKPGTDSLRGSNSVELCDWLIGTGAAVHVHDPLAGQLPEHWGAGVQRYDNPLAAVRGAQALVLTTDAPMYRAISADQLLECCARLTVLDANRHLPHLAAARERLSYFAVGTASANS